MTETLLAYTHYAAQLVDLQVPLAADFILDKFDLIVRFVDVILPIDAKDHLIRFTTLPLPLVASDGELTPHGRQVITADRKGIEIKYGTPDDFPTIAQMYQETAQRDGFAIRPIEYYLDAWRSFHDANMAQPILAEYQGKPIAAVILIKFDKAVTYMYGASTNEERNRMPTYLLQWEAIRWAKAQGAEIYDMWGAPSQFDETDQLWGVWRFKKGFNGQVVQHIGAWDYVNKPFWYWLYTNALPKYTEYLRSRNKHIIHS